MSENLPESMCCPCDHYGRSVMCGCTCHSVPPHRLTPESGPPPIWHYDNESGLQTGPAPQPCCGCPGPFHPSGPCDCSCHKVRLHRVHDGRNLGKKYVQDLMAFWRAYSFDRDRVAGVGPTPPPAKPACKTCHSEVALPGENFSSGLCWPCSAWRRAFGALCAVKTCFEVETVTLVGRYGTKAQACRRHADLAVKSGDWKET